MGASLNPALEDVRFCPRCGGPATISFPHHLACAHCGYGAYYNPSPVASVIPRDGDGNLYLARRGIEPGKGLWSMPGGFVDLGESVEDAAHREMREELDLTIAIRGLVGVYSKPDDRIVLIVFVADALNEPSTSDEALEVRAFAPTATAIPWGELAFWNDTQALRDYLRTHAGRPATGPPATTTAMDTANRPAAA